MYNFFLFVFFLFVFSLDASFAQTAHSHARQGDKKFLSKDFKKAEEAYRKSLENQKSDKMNYNLGNSIYNQQRYEEAVKQYEQSASITKDKSIKSNSFYNKGNAYVQKKEFQKAIESYQNSLRLNPNDGDAKQNLAIAKKMLLREQQQQQQNDKNQPNKDDPKQQPKDKNKDKSNDKNKDKNQQNDPKDGEDKQQNEMNQADSDRMMQIMEEEERKVQQRLRKGSPKPSKSTKDW
jgi:Ca-activated chloride channel homolog